MKKFNFVPILLGMLIISFSSMASPPAADTIVVDNNRSLHVGDNTHVTIDRRVVEPEEQRALEQFGTGFYARTLPGFKARLNYNTSNNPTDNGQIIDINLMNSVVGVVTLNDATGFKVLTVNLVTDADTVIEGANSIADINVGDTIAVSGLETEDGNLRVTRLEVLHNGSPYWLITGMVANLAADGFDINQQHVNISDDTPILCDTQLVNDAKVIVDFQAPASYTLGDSLTAQTVICYEDFGNPGNPNNVFINGDIQQVNVDQTQFTLDTGDVVNIVNATQFNGGTQTDLIAGINISVSGITNDDNDELEAEFIFFDSGQNPDYVFFHDYITDVSTDGNQITVGTHIVNLTQTTQIIGGTSSDLVVGVDVKVEGQVNVDGSINADYITLPLTSVSAFAPVLPADITQSNVGANDGSITVMGIEFKQNDLTFDPLGVFENGINEERDVIVFGYQDSTGANWVGFIYDIERDQGTPNNPNGTAMYFVGGMVSDLSGGGLKILGVTIGNLENAVFIDENGSPIAGTDFIASLSLGDNISATDAETYDRATNTLNVGILHKPAQNSGGSPNTKNSSTLKAGNKSVSGSGIITKVITDVLFRASF